MDLETHEILFSFDQSDSVLPSLLKTIQQLLSLLKTRSGKSIPLLQTHCVLIIDGEQARAAYLAQALSLAGYRVLTVPNSLEAFTFFLRGAFIPLLIIKGQDDPARRFFQQRLVQQVMQKFDIEVPLIRLTTKMESLSGNFPGANANLLQSSNISSFSSKDNSYSHDVTPSLASQLPISSISSQKVASRPSVLRKNELLGDPMRYITHHSESRDAIRDTPRSPGEQGNKEYDRSPFLPDQDISFKSYADPQPFFPASAFMDEAEGTRSAPPIAPIPRDPIQQTSPLKSPVKVHVKISLEGQSLGRYQVDTLIGHGPMGDVYQVYDRLRETRIALKAIQTDTVTFAANLALEEEHMFQREATILSRLKHAHIAPLLNTGKSYISGSSFIYKTMPFYAEGNLTQWLYGQGGRKSYPPYEVLPLIVQLGEVLQFMHDQQVLFLNFKPGNILLKESTKKMSDLELILSDFFIPFDSGTLPIANDALPYIAPEAWEGKAQPASDQYALAVLAYEFLTGRSLFLGTNEQIMKRLHLTRNPQPPSTLNPLVSSQLSNILLRALAKKPEERFASVGLFAQALQHFNI